MSRKYDLFISYNSLDSAYARSLHRLLTEEFGLRTWFAEEQVLPGENFIQATHRGLSNALGCLVLVGENGQGPWHRREVFAALEQQTSAEHFRMIPILLPSAKEVPDLPPFLSSTRWIDLRTDPVEAIRLLTRVLRIERGVALYKIHGATSSEDSDLAAERLPSELWSIVVYGPQAAILVSDTPSTNLTPRMTSVRSL